ncbi:MAG: hypothetical protein K2Q18_17595 [Bdellovibrionales bacterium]|nr:hypothetical protein [Bdellovibrionales bacterium]
MNEIYAINARKIKVLEQEKRELELKINRLTLKLVTSEFENKKLKRILEKYEPVKEDKI